MRIGRGIAWLVCAAWLGGCQTLLDFQAARPHATDAVDASADAIAPNAHGGAPASRLRVAVGGQHTCAISGAGDLYCWGYDQRNAFGLANPDVTGNRPVTSAMFTKSGPVTRPLSEVSAGIAYTCVIANRGEVHCAGRNDSNQLGSTNVDEHGPALVPLSLPATSVCAAEREPPDDTSDPAHACALLESGEVECWGANDLGQLGDPAKSNGVTKITLPKSGAKATQLACGPARTCVVTDGRDVVCWGARGNADAFGPPELPTVIASGADEVAVADDALFVRTDASVTRIDAARGAQTMPLTNVQRIRAAGTTICALTHAAELVCSASEGFANQWSGVAGEFHDIADFDVGRLNVCGVRGADIVCYGRDFYGEVMGDGISRDGDTFGRVTLP
jgi:hypothetical protein